MVVMRSIWVLGTVLAVSVAAHRPRLLNEQRNCRDGSRPGSPAVARYGPNGGAADRVIEGPHTLLCRPASIALGTRGEIFVLDQTDYAVSIGRDGPPWEDQVLVFDSAAQGDVAPIRTMVFSRTSDGYITGMAVDKAGRIYILMTAGSLAASGSGGFIRVYEAGARGRPEPIRVLSVWSGRPRDVVFDGRGSLYISDFGNDESGAIHVLDPDANYTEIRTIRGPETLLRMPGPMALGRADTLYVLNAFHWWSPCRFTGLPNTTVTVYAPGATGDVEPIRSLTVTRNGTSPGRTGYPYVAPRGLTVADDGGVYVWMSGTEALVYAPGSAGLVAPSRIIEAKGRTETDATGVTRASDGFVYQAFVPGLGFCL